MGMVKQYYIEYSENPELRHLVDWFQENYIPSSQLDGTALGGPIYLNGGPFYPLNVLTDEFGGEYDQETLELAVEHIELNGSEFDAAESDDILFSKTAKFFDEDKTPYMVFEKSIQDLSGMITSSGVPASALVRMFFANSISILEAYLCDKFVFEIFRSNEAKEKLLTQHPKFKERTLTLAQILENPRCVDDDIRSVLTKNVLWHRLSDVKMLYLKAFDILIRDDKEWFNEAKEIRHHIVHRNGKDYDGEDVQIDVQNTRDLVSSIIGLVSYVEDRFGK